MSSQIDFAEGNVRYARRKLVLDLASPFGATGQGHNHLIWSRACSSIRRESNLIAVADYIPPQPTPMSIAACSWWLAVLTPVSWVVGACIYYPGIVANENLPADADSSAIPIGGVVIAATMLLLLMMLITWLCVRRTEPPGSFFAWRRDQPVLSFLVSTIFIVLALICLVGDFWNFDLSSVAWYDYSMLPMPILLAVWLLSLRGAALSRKLRLPKPSEA
jgi:hypothetical protein